MPPSRQVPLPEDLCAAAEQKFGARFRTIEELLEFILRDLLQDSAAADENEQRIVEERLRELGYI